MTEQQSALILIVDDDYDFLEINRLVLERAGYRVVTAAEPKQALAADGEGEARPGDHRPDDDQPRLRLPLRPHHQGRPSLRRTSP